MAKRSTAPARREHLTILDFSDREFLNIVMDVADGDGWAESVDVAERLDMADKRSASSRLAWMKRYGAVEREHERDEQGRLLYSGDKPRYTQRWRLTEVGLTIATGKLSKSQERALEGMNDGAVFMTTRFLAKRAAEDSGGAKLFMREWRHGVGRY